MPRTLCRLLPALVLMAAALYLPALVSADESKPYIVIFEKTSAAGARVAAQDLASDEHFTNSQVYDDSLKGFAARLDAHDLAEVKDDPRVKAVVADKPVKMAGQVPLASGDNIPPGVRRVGAATTTTVSEASTANVAVIDTGIDLSHPDLNAAAGKNCVGSGAPSDDNGHGTHVAGTIAARNQGGGGAVGVAPGTKVYAVKVLNSSGSGYTSQIICGIDWVTSTRTDADTTNDIRVVNMSLGGSMSPNTNCGRSVNDAEHIAICTSIAAGVTYVVAAGNSGADLQTFAPASYPEVLTVTAIGDTDGLAGGRGSRDGCYGNADDTPASFSNFATRTADIAHTIAAPGVCIRSTYPGSQYANMSGTSMASPHVAGLVALCMGENGAHGPCWGKTPDEVRSIMIGASTTTAAESPNDVFSGAPTKAISGRYYGDVASTDFPSAANAIPVNTAYPAISGSAAQGATLTATNGTWSNSPTSYAISWLRCTGTGTGTCSDVSGATSSTYTLTSADVGKYFRVRVVARNANGAGMMRSTSTVAVAAPVAPAVSGSSWPVVSGTARAGSTLTATSGTWTGTAPITYTYAWLRCTTTSVSSCATITGAATSSYTVDNADVGKYLRVQVTATNARGSATTRSVSTAAVTGNSGASAPVNTVYPTISGTARVGSSLTATTGTWSGGGTMSYSYNWLRCTTTAVASCADISGATSSSYTLVSADRERYIRVRVTATNAAGSAWMRSTMLGLIA